MIVDHFSESLAPAVHLGVLSCTPGAGAPCTPGAGAPCTHGALAPCAPGAGAPGAGAPGLLFYTWLFTASLSYSSLQTNSNC